MAEGVSKDKIEIVVLVPDIDGLKAKGFLVGTRLTTASVMKRFSAYVDAYGPINGREIELTPVDNATPLSPATC